MTPGTRSTRTGRRQGLVLLLAGLLATLSGCAALPPDMDCASGNPVACARVGDQRFNGGRDGADLEEAQSYFGKSCERGFLPGCHGLGLVAREQKRFGEATRLLTDTCKRGYGPACTSAGDLQRTRNEKRPEVARALYGAACEQLDAEGCLQLALLEESGTGGASDPEGAKAHFEMAIDHYRSRCQQGYGVSCYRYAEFFAKGWGTETNGFQVRRLMEKSCAFGHAPACEYSIGER